MTEQQIQQEIRFTLSQGDARLWRNNTGKLQAADGRWVDFGLCKGSSDLIGLRQVTIQPHHVGQTLAVFAAVEVKTPKGRASADQQQFISTIKNLGGLAGIARSVTEAKQIIYPKAL